MKLGLRLLFRVLKMESQCASKGYAAVCQMNSTNDCQRNKEICRNLITDAAKDGADIVFLPESFDFIANDKSETLELSETLDGPTVNFYKDLARKNEVWLSLGGFHEKIPEQNRVFMTHILLDALGNLRTVYRKTHIFDVDIKGLSLSESDVVAPGNEIAYPVDTPIGKVGLQICYDLRFPELSLVQKQLGAAILTYPSAFTFKTGMAHWHILLRARAIENQCYVIAAAQTGTHNEKRRSYGCALITDPWGKVICECSEGNSFSLAFIDPNLIKEVRSGMPVAKHRRYDLYNNPQKV